MVESKARDKDDNLNVEKDPEILAQFQHRKWAGSNLAAE